MVVHVVSYKSDLVDTLECKNGTLVVSKESVLLGNLKDEAVMLIPLL